MLLLGLLCLAALYSPALVRPPDVTHGEALQGTVISANERPIDAKLFAALRAGNVEGVRKALAQGADPNANEANGWRPLTSLEGSSERQTQIAALLLAKGADVNGRQADQGYTPLISAANHFHDNVPLVKLLLDHGANVNASMNDGMTALSLAVQAAEVGVVQVLLAHGASVTPRTVDLRENATQEHERARERILKGIKTKEERDRLARALDEADAEEKPRMEEERKRNAEQIDRAFEPGYRMSGQTPAFGIAVKWDASIAAMLQKAGADFKAIDDNGWTILHEAVHNGNLEAIKGLLAMGLDPNVASKGGFRPLHLAMRVGFHYPDADVVHLLLAAGADPKLKNNAGQTPADLLRSDSTFFLSQMILTPEPGTTPEVRERFLRGANAVERLLDPTAAPIVMPQPVTDANGTHYGDLDIGQIKVSRTVRIEDGHAILELHFPPAVGKVDVWTIKDIQLENYDPITTLPIKFTQLVGRPSELRIAFPPGAASGGAVNGTYESLMGGGEFAEGPDANPGFEFRQMPGGSEPMILNGVPGRTLLYRIDSVTVSGKPIKALTGKIFRAEYNKPEPIKGLVLPEVFGNGKEICVIRYSIRVLPNTRWRSETTRL